MSGIRTVADLRARCVIDDITDCWHWRGATTGKARPSIWIADLKKSGTIGNVLDHFFGGTGQVWIATCGCFTCANPAHRKRGSMSELQKMVTPSLSSDHKARITLARRRVSRLTAEDAQAIRDSTEPLAVVAERYGMTISHISKIRCYKNWAPTNPWRLAA